jgi:hypothetical protein
MEAAMKCSSLRIDRRLTAAVFFFALTMALAAYSAQGKELADAKGNLEIAHVEPPTSSVLEDSYRYHRFGDLPEITPHPTIAPTGGWYRYGFPLQSHRWGWFGAEHYYPRVVWHRGYYGDRCRWCYRRGY